MKFKMKRLFVMCTVISVLISCQKEDPVQDGGQIRFRMSVGNETKVTADRFEEGDKVGLFVVEYDGDLAKTLQISGNWANNVSVTFDGNNWTPAKKIFWSENKVDAYGYYPYMSLVSVDEQPFSVALNQDADGENGSLGGYEASDLLWAKAEAVVQENETVALIYKHIMSKLIVKLVKGEDYVGDFPDVSELYIHNVVPSALADLTRGTVVKDPYGTEATIKAHRVDDATFEAILVPQRLESRLPFIEFISEDVSYLLEDTFYFRNGKVHVLELTINSNPDQVSVEIGGSIEGEW